MKWAFVVTLLGLLASTASPAPDYQSFEASEAEVRKLATPAYQRCLDSSGGVTSNMRACSHAEHERLDRILNAEYRKAMARLSSSASRTKLRSLQRDWLKTRWNDCYAAAKEEEGGTLWLLVVDSCGLGEMQNRIVWLKQYRG